MISLIASLPFLVNSYAQGSELSTRVSAATLPIPMPDGAKGPVAPDRLRAESPWTKSLAGDWRFRLTHGQIVNGRYALSDTETSGLKASSTESGNSARKAFDGDPDTRWCASGGTFPQFLQTDFEVARPVSQVEIAWERPNAEYTFRIEGGDDGVHWRTLVDRSAQPGVGDGSVIVAGAAVRYMRVVVLGASEGSWASIRELKIHYREGDRDVVWKPSPPKAAVVAGADDFVAPGFDDHAWATLAVPSNWEMAGYSIPTYNTVDDSVGLYRREIEVPAAWAGRRIVWRFDGALDGAEVFVNGRRAGYHESGYTAFDVDVTDLVRPGERNLLAVRVCKTTPSFEADTGDYQSMGGIYRDTRLIAVPKSHVADLTVRTPLSADYKNATLQVGVQVKGTPGEKLRLTGYVTDAATGQRLPVALLSEAVVGPKGTVAVDWGATVSGPKLWSAEKPNLYYVTLDLQRDGKSLERIEQRFGFRQVEIKNQVVLWNGKPIKCTGICRHDFWANKGFALTDVEWKKDLTMMKATNINAIRTSHYNHAARFLELCEERGFYILDEVPFCWIGDEVKNPAFAPPLLLRTAETIGRDKNRPCVLAWSLGNENPTGVNTQAVHDLAHQLDPTRPSFASGAGPDSVKGQELFDTHYPSPEGLMRDVETRKGIAPEVVTEHPHTFYQRETQDYDPGASDVWSEGLIATWDLFRRTPTLLGSFIWEWQSQGIADKFPDHISDFYFGLDHMRQENNKGIVDAYRNPKAEQWIVKMVYSPVQIPSRTARFENGGWGVQLVNHFTFTDLSELRFRWTAFRGKEVLGRGVAPVSGTPGATVDAKIAAPAGLTALELVVDRADGSNVTVARLDADGSVVSSPSGLAATGPLAVTEAADVMKVSSAGQEVVFDKSSGTIRSWKVGGRDRLGKGGPFLNLGEAKRARGDGRYYQAEKPPVTEGQIVTAKTLSDGSVLVTSVGQVQDSKEALGALTVEYTIRPNAEIGVRYSLDWTAADKNLWEIGLCLPLPAGDQRQAWLRDSYFTAYPDGHIGAPTGACGPKDAAFRASKRSLHWLTMTDGSGAGLALVASGSPLIGRASGATLFASREIAAAGPDDLSQSWFHAHDIRATKSKPLTGEFVLRAVGKG